MKVTKTAEIKPDADRREVEVILQASPTGLRNIAGILEQGKTVTVNWYGVSITFRPAGKNGRMFL